MSINIPPNILAACERNLLVMGAGSDSLPKVNCATPVHADDAQGLANRRRDALLFSPCLTFYLHSSSFFIKRLTKTCCLARSPSNIVNHYYTPSNSLSVQINLLDIRLSHFMWYYTQGSPFPILSIPLLILCFYIFPWFWSVWFNTVREIWSPGSVFKGLSP